MPCASSSKTRAGQPWVKPGHDGIVRNAISLLRLRESVIPTFREPASRAASTRRGAYASVPRMDPLLVYVILGAGAAGFTQGLSGFAFGLTAMAFWAWAVPPQLAAPMVVFGSLLGQMLAVGSLRRGFKLRRAPPLIVRGLPRGPARGAPLPPIHPTVFTAVRGRAS